MTVVALLAQRTHPGAVVGIAIDALFLGAWLRWRARVRDVLTHCTVVRRRDRPESPTDFRPLEVDRSSYPSPASARRRVSAMLVALR